MIMDRFIYDGAVPVLLCKIGRNAIHIARNDLVLHCYTCTFLY